MTKNIFTVLGALSLLIVTFFSGWYLNDGENNSKLVFLSTPTLIPTPLTKYQIDLLTDSEALPGMITIEEVLEEEKTFTSYLFSFEFVPAIDGNEQKKTTGMLNIPNFDNSNLYSTGQPLIIMMRGYVDETVYETGVGTKNASRYFADKGFITIAPDFLGYAGSDVNAADIFESRFQTYTTILSLIETIEQPSFAKVIFGKWDRKNIFIWAHSNGGQIALTVLEISGAEYPTTLWAPVTEGFPYSILYFTNESADQGKFIRKELSEFESLYDVDKFSIKNYLEQINAPIQLHQGTIDDAIPLEWTENFVDSLEDLEKEITYFRYTGADHNLRPDWDTAINRDLEFFLEKMNELE